MVMSSQKLSGGIMALVYGVVGAVIGLILLLLIIGNSAIITLINNGLTAICDSGWPLANLFDPNNGVVPMLIVVGIFIGSIGLALGIGFVATKGYK